MCGIGEPLLMPPSPRGSACFARSFSLRPAPKDAWVPSGNFGQCAMGSLASMASLATWNPQLAEPKGPVMFRIPVSPPNY